MAEDITEILQVPESPKARKYLKELTNLIAEEVVSNAIFFQQLNDAYLLQKHALEQEKKEFRETQIAQEAKNQEMYRDDLEKQLASASNDRENLQKMQSDLQQKISAAQVAEENLLKSIDTTTKEIFKDWVTEETKAQQIFDKFLDPEKFNQLSKEDLKQLGIKNPAELKQLGLDKPLTVFDAKGEPVDNKEFVTKLKSQVVRTPEQRYKILKDRLLNLLTENNDQGNEFDQVVARAMMQQRGVVEHLNKLIALGGGDVTPSQLLQLNKNNKTLGKLLAKLYDQEMKFTPAQLEHLTNLVSTLKEQEKDLATNRNQTQEMQKVLDKINKTLDETNVHTMKPK